MRSSLKEEKNMNIYRHKKMVTSTLPNMDLKKCKILGEQDLKNINFDNINITNKESDKIKEDKENTNLKKKYGSLKENQEQLIMLIKIIQENGVDVDGLIDKWNNEVEMEDHYLIKNSAGEIKTIIECKETEY